MSNEELKEQLKELIDEKFKGVYSKLDSIHDQVVRTNGRVTVTEAKIVDLEKANIQHIISCPQAPRIEVLEKQSTGKDAINTWVLRVLAVIGTIASIYGVYLKATGII